MKNVRVDYRRKAFRSLPAHWWNLTDDAVWADSVEDWDGSENGTVTIDSGGGPDGQDVALFNATGDYLDMGLRNPTTEGFTNFTIAAWASFSSFNTGNFGNFVFSWRNSGATIYMFDLYFEGGAFDVLTSQGPDPGGKMNAAGVTETVDTWFHMLATYASDGARELFIDSVSEDSVSNNTGIQDSSIRVEVGQAADVNASTTQFLGSCGMVGLWDRVLTQREIDFLYNSGNGRQFAQL